MALVERRGDSHLDLVSHVATNQRDRNLLATAGNDGLVSTWDVRNMKEEAGCEYRADISTGYVFILKNITM